MKELTLRNVPVEMQTRMKQALQDVWQAIGPDVLYAYDQEAVTVEQATLPGTHVRDIVLDMGYQSDYSGDKEALDMLYKLTWNARRKIAKEAFPERRYGW